MNTIEKQTLLLLLNLYEYDAAFHFASEIAQIPDELMTVLEMLRERRELHTGPAFQLGLVMNQDREDEQLANYLLDLETKLKKAQIIDFVRAVSPLIYRLFMRLVTAKIPNIMDYIHDTKDDRYDTWLRDELMGSDLKILRHFKPERNVTSNSLANLILQLDYPEDTKKQVVSLRKLERSVRNPLSHLIKPFDEKELRRTTNFSSEKFMNTLIDLSRKTGVQYDSEFYFDKVNAQIIQKYGLK
ncbi:hypothetical protein [Streptococcus moroccensis]|uniref:Csm6 HEPN domain-containing protein n=1 Tax=Streptococcus moroccensis TaxID=1451356 RepID=A0ABT9YVB5_9STRE|nr:hypothetical protein [Streptococcus moroccensis]MDQ0223536.1 hypothetical protein [Streptococcus moroccensis]